MIWKFQLNFPPVLGVLETLKVNDSGKGFRFLDLVCRQTRCNDAFVGITEKIVDRIEWISSRFLSQGGGKRIRNVEKHLLGKFKPDGIIGLLGDLYLLRKVVQINPLGT